MATIKLSRKAMNCEFEIILSGEDSNYLRDVAEYALEEVQELDLQLNCFNPTSEISYINVEASDHPVTVGSALLRLLETAKAVWNDTDGAFDITLGPLINLWRSAERSGDAPDAGILARARRTIGMEHVILDPDSNTVYFDTDGIKINLGAIGKGYAVGQTVSLLLENGIDSALIHGGKSTIYAIGDQPGQDGWLVGIRHPDRFDENICSVRLKDAALSVSGGVAQRDESVVENQEHILDPKTGEPVTPSVVSASVIVDDPTLADALSTAFYLRGRDFAHSFCETHTDVRAVIVEAEADSSGYQVFDIP